MGSEAERRVRDVQLHDGDAAVPGRAGMGCMTKPRAGLLRASGERPAPGCADRREHGRPTPAL
eukprot:13001452-Heterocapsa_arctica.AAC.1